MPVVKFEGFFSASGSGLVSETLPLVSLTEVDSSKISSCGSTARAIIPSKSNLDFVFFRFNQSPQIGQLFANVQHSMDFGKLAKFDHNISINQQAIC